MTCRITAAGFAVLLTFFLAGITTAAEKNREAADIFALDGARNIVEEEHFGIADGKMTARITYKTVFSLGGLWAPPFVSSDFNPGITLFGQPVATERYTWHPFEVERSGSVQGISVKSITALIPGTRAGVIAMTLKNGKMERLTVPLEFHIDGTLDRSEWWEFARTLSKTATTRKVDAGFLLLEQGAQAIAVRASGNIRWEDSDEYVRGALTIPASGETKLYLTFAIGPEAEAMAECGTIAANPLKALTTARTVYADRTREIYRKLPRLESDNAALVHFYDRSLVPLLLNRWDVPEFLLHPYYSTGSVNGGCICSYLWDFGEVWEILPLFDPEAAKAHIRQFVATDMISHFAFDPIKGTAWGPWYPVNQEKIVGLIYYYVKNTGDTAFLNDVVSGKTILEHVIANAMYGDDLTKPVALIDYGPSNSHLELRRGFPYNGVMPDLNGRRYASYLLAAELADVAGKPAPYLRQRAEDLKVVLKRELWNEKDRWFDFIDARKNRDTRYTIQIFKLFSSNVLDSEEESGLLEHVKSETEFLSEFGMHSLAKDRHRLRSGGYRQRRGRLIQFVPAADRPKSSTSRANPPRPRTF